MTASDLPFVERLDAADLGGSWGGKTLDLLLADPQWHLSVVDVEGALRGFVVARTVGPDEGELLLVAVDSAWRRRGLGAALVRTLVEALARRGVRRVYLSARAGNEAARELYLRLGFRELRLVRRMYTSPPEDGVDMVLEAVAAAMDGPQAAR